MNLLTQAIQYHEAGLKVIPFYHRTDGGVTFPAGYAKYREAQSIEDINTLFAADCAGIALLCTDGIEAFDIDTKHDPTGTITSRFLEMLKGSLKGTDAFSKCVVQKTKSGGWHIIYKTDLPGPNQKLTYLEGSKEAVIETRGQGGLLFIAPTPGYDIKMGSLSGIGHLSDQERATFFICANELNERAEAEEAPVPASGISAAGQTPGDEYNAVHTVLEMVERYGWKKVSEVGGIIRLNKPGSNNRDVHASIVKTATGEERFYPWTTATAFDPEKCYSPFGIYAVQEHSGDYSAAARELARQGYGQQMKPTKAEQRAEKVRQELPSILQQVEDSRFDYDAPIKEEETILTYLGERREYKVGGFGQIGVFTGHEKSGKSFVLGCIASAALAGEARLNFNIDLQGRKMLWFDTEQSKFFYQYTQKRIHEMGGKFGNVPFYSAFHLRKYSPDERLGIIEHYLYNTPGIGAAVLDGVVDLVTNYNDLDEVQPIVQKLMKWTDELNIMLLCVLHVNKGDGKLRGHIGSEIKNKCDFVISVAKGDDNDYKVSNPTGRYMSFPSFTFSRDDNGRPIVEDNDRSGSFPGKKMEEYEPEPAASPIITKTANTDDDVPF